MFKKINLKLGVSIVLALGAALTAIACGGESDTPYCVDGQCGGGSGDGGSAGTCNSTNCASPAYCSSNTCMFNGTPPNCGSAVCGAGTVCDTATNTCKVPSGSCAITCGTGTVCNNGVCVPGSSGTCNSTNCPSPNYCSGNTCVNGSSTCNSTNCPSPNYCSGNTCVNGGTGGSSGGVDVRFIPTLSNSAGYVTAQLTADGTFSPSSDTVHITSVDGITAACARLYGPTNKLMCNGSVPGSGYSCRYLNALKNVLGPKHGQSSNPLDAYFATSQALVDASADLVACASSSYSSCLFVSNGDGKEFLHRCDITNTTCQDNDPVGNSDFQIACALVGVP